jgi:hypothetical protein
MSPSLDYAAMIAVVLKKARIGLANSLAQAATAASRMASLDAR